MKKDLERCPWLVFDDPLYKAYHDKEWGVPVKKDQKLFEFLVLEAFQAGLSWRTILHKRENFRRAFAGFDPKKVARFGAKETRRLLGDPGIVRNRLKIAAAIENAKRFLAVQKEFRSFSNYMWGWIGGQTKHNKFKSLKEYPPFTKEAELWAKDLKARGFKFLGPTVVYSHMQAVGMVNDHTVSCFRYKRKRGN